jgi:sorting nexin-4
MTKVKGEGILEYLSDSLINSFSKIKNPDQRFIDIKDQIDKFEDNLNSADKLHLKISKRQAGNLNVIHHSYLSLLFL